MLHQVAERLEELVSDRQLLRRVVFWATANWLLDAASLWVFLRAYGVTLPVDALLVAFGLANVLAAIPILPGGLGVVEATYLTALIGFGVPRRVAAPAIATYRSAQYLMPIAIGALAYASLRVGPWKIEKSATGSCGSATWRAPSRRRARRRSTSRCDSAANARWPTRSPILQSQRPSHRPSSTRPRRAR